MSDSTNYQTKLSETFEKSYQKLIKAHYPNKESQDKAELDDALETIISALSNDPTVSPYVGHWEPWPHGTAAQGFELWKLHLSMPGLGGASQRGRILYLVNQNERAVHLLWIYTHQQYSKRPPDKELKKAIKELL